VERGGGGLRAFSLVKREVVPFQNLVFEHDCLSSNIGEVREGLSQEKRNSFVSLMNPDGKRQ
jgi:hypothetical protein